MRSDLRALRERIRHAEAGCHRDTPLRREYNRKLRALKISGGGMFTSNDMKSVKEDIEFLRTSVEQHTLDLTELMKHMDQLRLRQRIAKIEGQK